MNCKKHCIVAKYVLLQFMMLMLMLKCVSHLFFSTQGALANVCPVFIIYSLTGYMESILSILWILNCAFKTTLPATCGQQDVSTAQSPAVCEFSPVRIQKRIHTFL